MQKVIFKGILEQNDYVTGKNIYDLYSTLLSNIVAFGDIRCGFPGGLVVKNPPTSTGDTGSSPWVREIP